MHASREECAVQRTQDSGMQLTLCSVSVMLCRHPEETPEGDDRNVASLLTDQVGYLLVS